MALITKVMPRKGTIEPHKDVNVVRNIRHRVIIGGIELTTLTSWSREELAYSAGSTAEITARMFEAGETRWLGQIPVLDWPKISQDVIPLPIVITTQIRIGNTIFPEIEEFSGVLDNLHQRPMEGINVFTASSYARMLVNKRISETIAGTADSNKTTGKAIQDLVASHGKGLKTSISDKYLLHGTLVGNVFKKQMVKTIRSMTIWDLFENFAEQENADLFVKGDTLYFQPKATIDNKDLTDLGNVPVAYTYDFATDIINIDVNHAALFSHDVTVTVRSYQPGTQQSYEGNANMSQLAVDELAKELENLDSRKKLDEKNKASTAALKAYKPKKEEKGQAKPARIGSKEAFVFVVSNRTQEDCERIALKIMEDISRKEFIINLEVRARPEMNTRQYIQLVNYPSEPVNRAYAMKSLKISSDPSSGYKATITMVNHAVQTTGTNLGA